MLLGLAALLGVGVVFVVLGLGIAHRDIGSLDPPLPAPAELAAPGAQVDLPVRLGWIDTASQAMPRSAVLEPSVDPSPDEPYVMAHSVFVLEWADGRILLLDLGMDAESAVAFGRPMEMLAGAGPMEPRGEVVSQLGEATQRVAGVAFTHLHADHTAGATALCAALGRTVPLFQTPLQAERSNYTTRPGRAPIAEAGCLESRRLEGGPAFAIPGFEGVVVIPAAGHTPGSQVFVAHVRDSREPGRESGGEPGGPVRSFLLTGDVVNHAEGLRLDLPKPRLYSLLVVPEATERLGRVRRYLRDLVEQRGMTPLISHDRRSLEASGIPPWR